MREDIIENIVYILIILLVMATLVDLNIPIDKIFELIFA